MTKLLNDWFSVYQTKNLNDQMVNCLLNWLASY